MLKNIYWLTAGFIICFLLLVTTSIVKISTFFNTKPVANVSTNQGNSLKPLMPLAILTNRLTLTNELTISNILLLFADDSNYRAAPFVFYQTNDNLHVVHFERFGDYKIHSWSTEGLFFGPGVDYSVQQKELAIEAFIGYKKDWWMIQGHGSKNNVGVDAAIYFGK